LQSTAWFVASVTCGLTGLDRDQLWNPTLASSMGLPFHFTHLQYMSQCLRWAVVGGVF